MKEEVKEYMNEILNQVLSIYKDKNGLYAVYIFNTEQTEISYKIIDNQNFQEKRAYEILQNVLELSKMEDFKMLLMEFLERYLIKKVSNDTLILIISDSSEPIGRVLTIVNRIKVS